MEKFGDGGQMACEISLGPLGHSFTAPADEDVLRKTRVGILDLDKGELYPSLREFLD